MYILNKSKKIINVSLPEGTVVIKPLKYHKIPDMYYLSEIQQIVDIYNGNLKIVNELKDVQAEIDFIEGRAIPTPVDDGIPEGLDLSGDDVDIEDVKNLLSRMGDLSADTKESIKSDLKDEDINTINEVKDALDKTPIILTDNNFNKLVDEFSNKKISIDIDKILNSNSLTEDAKLRVVMKIADYLKIEYSPRIKLKGLLEKIENIGK